MSTRDFNVFIDRLWKIREGMNEDKDIKLSRRWRKHGDYRQWKLKIILEALDKEIKELKDELNCKYPRATPQARRIKDEIIDVSNVLDFLYDVLNLGAV